jgi:hypothetical protein
MPDGPLCSGCRANAFRRRGPCGGCGVTRLLPGADANGGALCVDCVGIEPGYFCSRCGTEWELVKGLCEWCQVGDVLDDLLAGDVELSALRARLVAVARPDRTIHWLRGSHQKRLLRQLATCIIPLSHEGLDGFEPRRPAEHVRGLLVATGLLPCRDEHLARFDRYVSERLASFAATNEHEKMLVLYARWQLRPKLVSRSELKPLSQEQVASSTRCLRVVAQLLAWLGERGHELGDCTQPELDEWFCTSPGSCSGGRVFVRWAIRTRRCPTLVIPVARASASCRALDDTERRDILIQQLNPATGHLEHRVAVMFMVLLGQRFTAIAKLRLDDVIIENGGVGVRLGQGVTPVPPPFGAMVEELVARRPNLNTAINPTSPWLFPGRTALNHLTPGTFRKRATKLGIHLAGSRTGALRQLVLDCPPPVVADMLGYSYEAIDRHAIRAGSPWSSYAAMRAQGQLPVDLLDVGR